MLRTCIQTSRWSSDWSYSCDCVCGWFVQFLVFLGFTELMFLHVAMSLAEYICITLSLLTDNWFDPVSDADANFYQMILQQPVD